MFCERCGTQATPDQRFCGNCGKPFGMAVVPVDDRRVERHLRLLSILWIARGVLRLLEALALFTVGNFLLSRFLPRFLPNFIPLVMNLGGSFIIVTALASMAIGVGLMQRESWGRIAALILAFLALLSVPFGTALGIYTLWVLLPARSEVEYERLARAA